MPKSVIFSFVFLVAGCSKPAPETTVPVAEAAPEPELEAGDEMSSESVEDEGGETLYVALPAGENLSFCCASGKGESGSGCVSREGEGAVDECLREGKYVFSCEGRWVACEEGACTCGEEVTEGKRMCCASVDRAGDGATAHDCSEWSDPDYTGCKAAGRDLLICGSPECKQGSASGVDCTCGG